MLASFSIVPVGSGEDIKAEVARVIDVIDRSGLNYRAGAVQTTVEGEFDEVMRLIGRCHGLMKSIAPRVLTSITIDDRTGEDENLIDKIKDVEELLGREIKHE